MPYGQNNLVAHLLPAADFLTIPTAPLSENLSVDVGQIVVSIGFPFVGLKLGNPLEAVVGVIAVVA